MAGGAADERAHAGKHFFHMERLRHIVIGTGVDTGNLVAPAVAGGEDEHRHGLAGRTPFFNDGDAVELRQADIEDDGVIGLGIAEIMAFLAVECLIDNITGFFQRIGQLTIEIGIVLNNENTHCPPFPVSRPAGASPVMLNVSDCFPIFRRCGQATSARASSPCAGVRHCPGRER